MLNEAIGVHKLSKLLTGDEVVLATVLFARARAAGGVRNAETVALGVLFEEALKESRFAGARRAGDDNGAVFCEEGSLFSEGSLVLAVVWRGAFDLPVEDIVAS